MTDKLVFDLRAESLSAQKMAWERADGGQDYAIAAQLADAAADRIETQAARIAALEAALAPFQPAKPNPDKRADVKAARKQRNRK